MYVNVSDNYKSTISANSRRFTAHLKKNGQILGAQIKTYSTRKYSSTGEDFTLGCAFSSSVTISCITDDLLKNQEISLETGLYIGSEIEYVPDGVYTITSAKKKDFLTELTGYDRMYVYGSQIFEVTQFPENLSVMAEEVAEQLGTTFDVTCLSETDDLQVTTMPVNCTLQNLAGYLAGLLGRNAYIDRSGKLTFQAFMDSGYIFDGSRISDPDVDSTVRVIDYLKCATSEEEILESGSGTGYITMQNPLMTQTILDQVAERISGFSYYAAEVYILLGDSRIDPWDMITYTGDKECKILCHEVITSFDGGLQMDVASHALSESEQNGYRGPLQQKVDQAKQEAEEAKKEITKLDESLDQKGVLNRLTNNGKAQGFYVDEETGDLYINASYIVSGILSSLNGETWIKMEDGTFSFANGLLTYDPETGLKISGNLIADGKITVKKTGWDDAIIEYVSYERYAITTDADHDHIEIETSDPFYVLEIKTTGLKIDKLIANIFNCTFGNFSKMYAGYACIEELYVNQKAAVLMKGSYVHTARGASGSTGYVKIAQITISSNYQDAPVILHVLQRGREESILSIWFENKDNTDPGLKSFTHQGGQEAYLAKSAESTWDLYCQKSEAYDNICVSEFYKSPYDSGISVDWMDEHAYTLPTGYVASAEADPTDPDLKESGRAADAKATGDAIAKNAADIKDAADAIAKNTDDIGVLQSRMNTFTALPAGSTSGDAELRDIRVGFDGTVYDNAGDAVRGQASKNKEAIDATKTDLGNTQDEVYNVQTTDDFSFIIGGITIDGGTVSSTVRVRNKLAFAKKGSSISVKSGFTYRLALYSENSTSSFVKSVDFTSKSYTFEKDYYFIASIRDADETEWTEDTMSTAVAGFIFHIYKPDTKIDDNAAAIADLSNQMDWVIGAALPADDITFENGGLSPSDGTETSVENRIRSNIIKAKTGSLISLKTSGIYKFGVWKYNDENKFIGYRGLSTEEFIADADMYIRIVMAPYSSGTCVLGAENDLRIRVFSYSVDDISKIALNDWKQGYIPTNSAAGDILAMVVSANASWAYQIIPVETGDKFKLTCRGGSAPRAWCFTDGNYTVISNASAAVDVRNLELTAEQAGYLVVNAAVNVDYFITQIVDGIVENHEAQAKAKDRAAEHLRYDRIIPPTMPEIRHTISSVPFNKTTAMTLNEIHAGYDSLLSAYPDYVTKTELGYDTSGAYRIYRYDFCPSVPEIDGTVNALWHSYKAADYPVVIMDACIHGSERPCAKALLNLMALIANAKDNSILGWLRNNVHFVIIPVLNTYGYANKIRTNANSVDLNRNFPVYWEKGETTTANERYRGESPLSEKETQYINAILTEYENKAVCYYSWHTHGLFTGYDVMTCFSIPANFEFDRMQNIGFDVIKSITASGWTNHELPVDSGYIGEVQVSEKAGLATYTGASYGIPTACPEVMYRYYDGGTSEVYNVNTDCMNVEYMLYAVADACRMFLYTEKKD